MARDFTLEDARRLALLRSYLLIVEKKATELALSDGTGTCFSGVVSELRECLRKLDILKGTCTMSVLNADCHDGYERCDDGVCRAWCS
jgi:hypothetical protein